MSTDISDSRFVLFFTDGKPTMVVRPCASGAASPALPGSGKPIMPGFDLDPSVFLPGGHLDPGEPGVVNPGIGGTSFGAAIDAALAAFSPDRTFDDPVFESTLAELQTSKDLFDAVAQHVTMLVQPLIDQGFHTHTLDDGFQIREMIAANRCLSYKLSIGDAPGVELWMLRIGMQIKYVGSKLQLQVAIVVCETGMPSGGYSQKYSGPSVSFPLQMMPTSTYEMVLSHMRELPEADRFQSLAQDLIVHSIP